MPRTAFFLLLLLAAVPAADSFAAEPAALDGWGAFKFGMSPDQARAVPGQEFGKYSRKDLLDRNNGAMASKKPALIGGVYYNFNLFFNAFERLSDVGLWHETTTSTQADCETAFLTMLSGLEKSYGHLAPVYARRKKDDQGQLAMDLEWVGTPPRYQLATVFFDTETAYVWQARKSVDSRFVDASAVWSGDDKGGLAVCLTEIEFKS